MKISEGTIVKGGIKCDAPGCGYYIEEFTPDTVEDYLAQLKKHLNESCPRCGANLLVEADYKNLDLFLKITCHPIMRFIYWVCKKTGLRMNRYRLSQNGTGVMTVTKVNEK